MSEVRRGALALGLAMAVGACASPTVSLRQGPRAYTAESYDVVLQRWTREGHQYALQGLDDRIAVTATYESWDFRWAYVVRYAQDFRLTTPERQELLQHTLEAAQQEHEFYVALYTQSRRWGELTRPTSAWRVLLLNDRREEVAPVAIEPINRPGAVELTYFPYTTVWRQAFRIRFPKYLRSASGAEVEVIDERVRSFRLRFSGPLGTTDLVWNVTH
ncbi:MAG: hypothetical protein EPO40_20765 [Myxococcaceae bacterium]|nr:MAG: hypothetical protein EPO40_20765 [Myxococcaceae bacterium]